MLEARNKGICTECGTVRTVLQIRKILEIPQNVDVLTFVRGMKEKLDGLGHSKTSRRHVELDALDVPKEGPNGETLNLVEREREYSKRLEKESKDNYKTNGLRHLQEVNRKARIGGW
jgi:hypothetical protein